MKQKKNFYPGNDVNQFITALNKAYMIQVIPELATYPSLEEEFVKAAQDLLDQCIFQQMVDSKQDTSTFEKLKTYLIGCPRGVMVKAMNCGIVVREFVLQSRYYVHFRANTLGKGMNPLILPPAMGK